ncbi:hypothetical protein Ddye_015802 [Dipteronia dyeriana]|uniref:Phytocyanin domain-containing protein n=1 Tax=Dipteronia dyeriana TaxID=168575 RepID=A0AAD9U684_9ROSI|nr:hypothetical protein Ddye_015802 [Dipteronia dyeriana]
MAMALAKKLLAFLLMIALLGVSMPAVYKVGDSAGWTMMGNVDYGKWASTKNFHSEDVIVFEYNNEYHNVKQVTHEDFQSCNAGSPIAVYSSGSESISLKRTGHYYFLCGYPGHFQGGQKVDVLVTPSSSRSSTDSLTSASYASPPSTMTMTITPPNPIPAKNSVSSLHPFQLWLSLLHFFFWFTPSDFLVGRIHHTVQSALSTPRLIRTRTGSAH